MTIPERTLTVDPAESRIGTTIGISGTGWPTGTGANLVGIYYDSVQYATAISCGRRQVVGFDWRPHRR